MPEAPTTPTTDTALTAEAQAWRRSAPQLARWTWDRMANRSDAFGHYIAVENRRDADLNAYTDKKRLTVAKLERHYRGESTGDILGLHSTVYHAELNGEIGACRSLWGAIDIDRHGDEGDPETNRRAALAMLAEAQRIGLAAVLTDSNGAGGFHLLVLFDDPAPAAYVFHIMRWIARNWKAYGLAEEPEVFPKQDGIGPDEFGNWLRLPGRHHTRDHFTRVWDGQEWLAGAAAVKALMATGGTSISAVPAEILQGPKETPRKTVRRQLDDLGDEARNAQEALGRLGGMATSYDDWIKIGLCLTPLGNTGLLLWIEWSKGAPDKFEEGACERKWKTFRRQTGKTAGLGSLFKLAKDRGWVPPWQTKKNNKAQTSENGHKGPSTNGDDHPPETSRIDEAGGEDEPIIDRWPKIAPEAFHGLAGRFVQMVETETESDPIAVLMQFLVAFGCLLGRGPHFIVGATRHYLNLFASLVGLTAVGRKGSSWDIVRLGMESFDPDWAQKRIAGGLVSGEGLIFHVRDPIYKREPIKVKGRIDGYQMVLADEGVEDKRLLVHEGEFSRVLKAINRKENTLSDVLRLAWESGNLATLSKNSPNRATGAHVCVITHVTNTDVREHLSRNDLANGFGNRFLWVCVRRSRILPRGGNLFAIDWAPFKRELGEALEVAGSVGTMRRDPEAEEVWSEVYEALTSTKPGLLGAITNRADPQTMRLACLYALLDGSPIVRAPHLLAALALWDYCADSARFIFGESLGNPDQEKLLAALKETPDGLTRADINLRVFGNHKKAKEITNLLSDLLTHNRIHPGSDTEGRGRPAKRWLFGGTPGSTLLKKC